MDAVHGTTLAIDEAETVVCRSSGGMLGLLWTLVVFEALLVLLTAANIFLASGIVWSDEQFGLFMFDACILSLCVFTGLYVRRACVIADKKGLRWRQVGCWREAGWEEVAAYYGYQHSSQSSSAKLSVRVTTSEGSLVFAPDEWSSSAELLQSIKQNAREVSGPGLLGPQVKKNSILPLHCRYDTAINRNILGWLDGLHKYGLLAVIIYFGYEWFTTHTLPGWGWLLTPTGIFVVVKQTLPLALRPMYRATQPRLGDKIIADEEGLRFVTVQSDTAVCWEDITDFYAAGIRYVVVTENGEYDFLNTLSDSERLRMVIPLLATNVGRTHWRLTDYRSGTMRVRQIGLAGGRQSVESRYHYRSHVNCAQLWSATLAVLFLVGVTCGPALIAYQSGAAVGTRELIAAAIGVFGLCALLWLWASYWVCGIRTNEEGLTQTTLLGTRRLAWSQVLGLRWSGNEDLKWGVVDGTTGTLKFWKGIGDADRLADEILVRCP